MTITILGSGTSHGIPVIACDCPVCTSTNPYDKRTRSSALITQGDTNILIDCGPEFRFQCLREKITHIEHVLLTHSHADHLHGIDDLRVFSCVRHHNDTDKPQSKAENLEHRPIPIYANTSTIKDFKNRFDYLFKPVFQGGGRASVELYDTATFLPENPLSIEDLKILPVPMMHGSLHTTGFLISRDTPQGKVSFAYLTDCSAIPDSSFELISQNAGFLDTIVIDGLRSRPHSTHFSFDEALAAANRLGARRTYFTHFCHDFSHTQIQAYLAEKLPLHKNLSRIVSEGGLLEPAYDGLKLEI